MVLIRIPLPGPEEASEAIPAPPGNDVDVEVGNALAMRLLMATNVPSALRPISTARDNVWTFVNRGPTSRLQLDGVGRVCSNSKGAVILVEVTGSKGSACMNCMITGRIWGHAS